MTTECVITFDNNPDGVYYSGQTLSGTVKLITVKPKSIRAVYITIYGRAKVRWTEREHRSGSYGKIKETYKADEQYLSSKSYVVGDDCAMEQVLPVGTHIYKFQVLLPHQLPSSFACRNGNILYDVKLTIDRPLSFDNEFRQQFTVIYPIDLNINPSNKMPIELATNNKFWCGCGIFLPLNFKIFIPFSGYACGQKIPVTISVSNGSTIECNGIVIKLNKIVQYTATYPCSKTRNDTIKIFEKRLPAVLQQSPIEYKVYVPLPSTAPSTPETCSFIHVSYNMEIIGEFAGFYNNHNFSFPITIGTVPIYESARNPANVITIQPTAPVSTLDGDLPPAYAQMMPPTYEEATAAHVVPFEDDDDDDKTNIHIKDVSFTPKYPMYYNFEIPSAPPNNSLEYTENCPYPNTSDTSMPHTPCNDNTNTTEQTTTTYGWTH